MATASTIILEARPRQVKGRNEAWRVRRAGMIPAVLYGHKEANVPLAIPYREFEAVLRSGARMVDLKLNGKSQKVLIKEVQYDPLGDEILHVDFTRVSLTEKITISVPVEMVGHAAGSAEGGVLDQVLKSLDVRCLPTNIPESIKLVVTDLKIGDSIFVKNVPPIPGVEILNDPEAIVITVHAPKEEPAAPPPEEAAAAAPAEPEVIGEKERLERAERKAQEEQEKSKEKEKEKKEE